MSIIKTIKNFQKNIRRTLFTTPGHCQGKVIPFDVEKLLGKKVFQADYSEIEGFDNIRNPEGSFLESQKWASEIYNSKQSFYLFNGSSSGIMALMLATVKEGDKVLIARNAHISIYNALVLTGAKPVWLENEWNTDWNISGAICPNKVKEALDNDNEIKALLITSPTYEGITSDIHKLAGICKERNVLLIVDEAHGALWNFSRDLPTPSIIQGADATVQSLHKTTTALTQGAIMHISQYSKINPEKVQNALNIVNSTSPSYLILASVEGSLEYLESQKGRKKLEKLLNNIEGLKKELSKNKKIKILSNDDKTKLFIGIEDLSGYKLSSILMNTYDIEDELCNSKGALFITGIGTDYKKLKKLKKALIEIADFNLTYKKKESCNYIQPEVIYTPREAYYMDTTNIPISECVGKISAELIIPYPPGIPVLMPGETIQQEHLEYLEDKSTIKIISL